MIIGSVMLRYSVNTPDSYVTMPSKHNRGLHGTQASGVCANRGIILEIGRQVMDREPKLQIVYVHMLEFLKLKDEQLKRIDFRDHLIYAHLIGVAGVAAWAISHPEYGLVFLLIPWLCFILGWSYLVNDDRVSAIGAYIRKELTAQIRKSIDSPESTILGWEVVHRSDLDRVARRVWQFIVDEVTFVISGFAALGAFLILSKYGHKAPEGAGLGISEAAQWGIVGAESVMMAILGFQFWRYADFKRGPD